MIIRYWVWYFAEKVRTQQMINVAKWMLKRLDNNQCRDTRQYIHPGNIVECDILLGKLGLRLFGWTQGDLEYACAKIQGKEPDAKTGLVPCGCGGKAAVKKGVNHRSGYYVICEKCECNIGLDRDDYLRPYGAYPTEEQAVSDWDTAMGYTSPPRPGAIGPETDGTAPNGDKGAGL